MGETVESRSMRDEGKEKAAGAPTPTAKLFNPTRPKAKWC